MQLSDNQTNNNNNNNSIFYLSQQEIKAVVQSHNEEHISIILSHKTHAYTHSCYKQYTVTTIYCDIMSCLQEWCTSRTPAQTDRVRRSVLPLLCFPALCPGRSCRTGHRLYERLQHSHVQSGTGPQVSGRGFEKVCLL